jgi:hypothetical protein
MRLLSLFMSTIAFVVGGAAVASEKNETSVETMPPVVVQTVPQAGATEVDPALNEIRVMFSKDMMTNQMWSWVRASKDTFPETSGDARFLEDNRTCVLPVKLLPGETYAIWINSREHISFQDLGKRPAVPYLLVFETKKDANGDGGNKQKGLTVEKTLESLLRAIEKGDREAFVVHGTDQVKQGMTQPLMDVLKTQLGARLKKGYQASHLGQLKQGGHQVHLWKSTFADAGDDVVFRLAIKDGKVAGFFLQ